MNISERVAHLANLTFIMDFHEKLGTSKNSAILREFQRNHDSLIEAIEKQEKADEARTSK